ncbi:MAG: L-histidine Nalpha-methyltransferase [Thermoleophilaceae bacterium]|jgi:L-histidine N-alpha-methyltransferase|nr:L-histidine Nalpha-methyltransferase [Thermoleophilaceae bacterium]
MHLPPGGERTLREDVLDGLTRPFKEIPPKHFYDARGSELFEQICELPEYYPTRTERSILEACADQIAERTGAVELVELGAGYATKTRILIEALALERFIPVDVSEATVRECARQLVAEYPALEVHGLVGDFERHLVHLPATAGPRMVAFLGGTIGNFPPGSRRRFLRTIAKQLGPDGWLLLGTDLVKEPALLEAAYDDSAGVTAEFNLNVLRVMNRELGCDFDLDGFDHVAFWDPDREWIEMRLCSKRRQTVRFPDLDLVVHFAQREELRTEISAKFTRQRVEGDFAAAGLELVDWHTDPDELFALSLARPAP